jgi:hypothetical protein
MIDLNYSLHFSAPLVPVFSFGETDLYDQFHNPEGSLLRKCQEFIKHTTGIAPVIPIGRGFFQYSFGLVPKRKPIYVVGMFNNSTNFILFIIAQCLTQIIVSFLC